MSPDPSAPNLSLRMVCAPLVPVPRHALAEGYRVRPYRDGDGATWTDLQRAAEPFFAIADDLFEREYGARRQDLPGRMWFVETVGGEPAGSISAWWEHAAPTPDDRGRIHWVVVHPAHQRRGLSKAMMTVAMERLARDHDAAVLGTSSGRTWAVKVYLDFGFRPDPADLEAPESLRAWHDVAARLGHPALARLPPA